MRFELSEDQQLLRNTTRDFLAAEFPLEKSRRVMEHDPRGFEPGAWTKLADMGYLGLTVPAARGGQGLGAVELAAVCEELGRACPPGPVLDAVLAADLLAAAAGQDALVRDVVTGKQLVVLARADDAFAGTAPSSIRVEGGRIRGEKFFVPFGAAADALLVETPGGVALVRGPFKTVPLPTIDLAQRFTSVTFDHTATIVAPRAALERTDRLAAIGASAQLLGVMQRALEMTLEYVQTRQAFRKPIGAFQALQHRLADMLLRVEFTRSAVYRAAWALDAGDEATAVACAAAKAYAGDASRLVCGEAIQMHGGIGFTWELDLHVYFKRAKTLEQHYGSTAEQLDRALGAAGL